MKKPSLEKKEIELKEITGLDLVNIIVKQNYIEQDDIDDLQVDFSSKGFDEAYSILITSNLVTSDLVGQAMSEFYSLNLFDLKSFPPNKDLVKKISYDIASQYKMVVFAESKMEVFIATSNPDEKLIPIIKEIFPDKEIKLGYALPESIEDTFLLYKNNFSDRISDIMSKGEQVVPDIVKEIFEDALAQKASDIHFEPFAEEVVIRFRIDGVLQDIGILPKNFYENIVNRLKVISKLRLDEHFETQDGSIRYLTKKNTTVDMRISIAPVMDGEKIVIRVLFRYVNDLGLDSIGLSDKAFKLINDNLKNPFGLILVSGPTGSGKTTTLYAAIRDLVNSRVNITTIEDPVEYRVDRVNQIQVNEQKNITFAKALRSIVRQDPDIILVGEIRDNETAEIAVNSALTGHLVLSTFHANDAVSTLPRLYDMGVEPFLLSSTIDLIISQRLIRTTCPHCKYSQEMSVVDLKKVVPGIFKVFPKTKINVFKGKGCKECGFTGYKGRTAVFEVLAITHDMKDALADNIKSIQTIINEEEYISMFEDGLDKVKKGVTDFEELVRVVKVPEKFAKE